MLWNTLLLALKEIRRNLARSFLTVLGILIGVAAVITMVTLGNGATQAVSQQISSLGSNLLMVRPGQRLGGGRRDGHRWRCRAAGRARLGFDDRALGFEGGEGIWGAHDPLASVRGWTCRVVRGVGFVLALLCVAPQGPGFRPGGRPTFLCLAKEK